MGVLRVDTDEQLRLAGQIRRAADEAQAAGRGPAQWQATVQGLGSGCLVEAAGAFLLRWRQTLDDVTDDARRLADALELLARAYSDAESMTRTLIEGHDR